MISSFIAYDSLAAIEDQTTGQASSDVLNVAASIGDPPPRFACFIQSNVEISYSVNWRKMGSTSLPDQLTQSSSLNIAILTWNRPLEFLDTGAYLCDILVGTSLISTTTLTLNLEILCKSIDRVMYQELATAHNYPLMRTSPGHVHVREGLIYTY